MTYDRPIRSAAAAGLALVLTGGVDATAAAVTPAERQVLVAPLKNTSYTGGETVYGVTVTAKIKIGNDVTRVKKATFKLRCDEGTQKVVRKNLKMYDVGRFSSTKPGTNVSGNWLSKHKVDLVVQTSNDLPCSNLAFSFTATD
jgi:hypothetical protein